MVESSSGTIDAESTIHDQVNDDLGTTHAFEVLDTHWHEYSDAAIQSAVSRLSPANSPADAPINPYHTTLRVLSSAVHRLSKAHAELEESRRMLQEKEAERRARAAQLMKDLQPSERDVAKRVLNTIFPGDEDDEEHTVLKKQSRMVSDHCLHSSMLPDTDFPTSLWLNP